MTDKKDALGDRMKSYELHETGRRFLPMLPVYARIDGRGFSKFTKGMDKPFDVGMSDAMIETTRWLVKETHALVGYTQSDEISLLWKADHYEKSIFFDGKIIKMSSVLAGMATAAFNRQIRGWKPYEDRMPSFDARVLQLPLDYEAANMFLWRAIDAKKNATSMATRTLYSPSQMHGKNQADMRGMLAEKGVTFEEYPASFRFGTFVKRIVEERPLTEDEKKFPNNAGQSTVIRSRVSSMLWPAFHTIANREAVLFTGAEPVLRDDLLTFPNEEDGVLKEVTNVVET